MLKAALKGSSPKGDEAGITDDHAGVGCFMRIVDDYRFTF